MTNPRCFQRRSLDLVWKYRLIHEFHFLGKSHVLELVSSREQGYISSQESALFMSSFVFIAFTSSLLIIKIPITMVMKRGIKRCMQAVSDAFVFFFGRTWL